MRTNIKDIEYFKNYIELNKDDIKFYVEGLEDGTTPKDRIWAVKRQILQQVYILLLQCILVDV